MKFFTKKRILDKLVVYSLIKAFLLYIRNTIFKN